MFLLLVGLGFVVLRTAWTCDDAFITFRTIDNLIHGHGLRWNIAERVQSFTHPLWLFFLTVPVAVTREAYLTSMIASAVTSLVAVSLLVLRVIPRGLPRVATVVLLGLSNSFIDYATSGLENPLTFLLLAAFLASYCSDGRQGSRLLVTSLLACLLTLNRLDLVLLVAPPLVVVMATATRPIPWTRLGLTWLPLVLWLAFSTLYFGSPIPNTAYAKLGSGHDPAALLGRGLDYLVETALFDPVVAVIVVGGCIACLASRSTRDVGLAVGILAYIVYVVRAGGDFMLGRMLTAPFLVALTVIMRRVPRRRAWAIVVVSAACSILSGVTLRPPSWLTGSGFGIRESRSWGRHGISDERHAYYPGTGLLSANRSGLEPTHPWADEGRQLRLAGPSVEVALTVGMRGYYAGPEVHLIDRGALCDPLLARLPARYFPDWRVGHYWRVLPPGYAHAAASPDPRTADSRLDRLTHSVWAASRAPLLRRDRWSSIWDLAAGRLIDGSTRQSYRLPGLRHATLGADPKGSLVWTDPAGIDVTDVGIELSTGTEFTVTAVRIVSSSPDWRSVEIGSTAWRREITLDPPPCRESATGVACDLRLPRHVTGRSVSYLRVFPTIDPRPGTREGRQVVTSVVVGP